MIFKIRSIVFILFAIFSTKGCFSALEDYQDTVFSYSIEKIASLHQCASQTEDEDTPLIDSKDSAKDAFSKLVNYFNPDPKTLERGLYKIYEDEILDFIAQNMPSDSQIVEETIESFYMAPWLSLSNIALASYVPYREVLFSLIALVEIRHLEPFVGVYKEFLKKTNIVQDVDDLIGKFQKSCKTS